MGLWTEVDPADLTGSLRVTQEQTDVGVLSDIFPALYQDDVKFSWLVDEVLEDIALYGEFDTESTIGKEGGRGEKTMRLLPLSRKLRLSEYEQVTDPALALSMAEQKGQALVGYVTNRLNIARAAALVNGALGIDENKVKQAGDFGRSPDLSGLEVTLTSGDADPVEELQSIVQAVRDESGTTPNVAVTTTGVVGIFGRAMARAGYITTPGVVSPAAVNEVLASYGLPALRAEETRIAGQRLIPEGTLALASTEGLTGRTVFAPTVESKDPRYNLQPEVRSGIVAAVYDEDDPPLKWVMAKAIALPIMSNPNTTAVATIL